MKQRKREPIQSTFVRGTMIWMEGLNTTIDNQDLLRSSIEAVPCEAVARALLWLRGNAPYPYPTSIHLNLTLRCTARCLHCLQWTWPSHTELEIRQLENLFRIFKSWGVKTITFGGGNPLLYDHICLALQLAHQANMQVGIISEGIEMPDDLADAISQYASWIRFSLDGPNSNIHDKIRNKPGLFDCVMQCITKLQTRKRKPLLGLNCVIQKDNLNFLPQMIDLAERISVDILLFKLAHGEDQGGRFLPSCEEWRQVAEWIKSAAAKGENHVATNLNELGNLLGRVFRDEDVVQGRPVSSFYLQEQIRCFTPLFFLTCDSEGNMYPCDYLQADTRAWSGKYGVMRNQFSLGNILENDLQVLENLTVMMRDRVHALPANGYSECGCCTRFCQLNASLTRIDRELQSKDINVQTLTQYFDRPGAKTTESNFL
jgi:MoaA/NifB/PqqE/SkfB family radical SAM enzyme